MDNLCGNCKHWHEFKVNPYKCRQGACDKVPKGTAFTDEDVTYEYDGWSFYDEHYDDAFGCFEIAEARKEFEE